MYAMKVGYVTAHWFLRIARTRAEQLLIVPINALGYQTLWSTIPWEGLMYCLNLVILVWGYSGLLRSELKLFYIWPWELHISLSGTKSPKYQHYTHHKVVVISCILGLGTTHCLWVPIVNGRTAISHIIRYRIHRQGNKEESGSNKPLAASWLCLSMHMLFISVCT